MKITIPQPCHENWNKMLPEEKGRFCLSCQKCVYDLTNSTDVQILDISKQKDICVRINAKQIERINSKSNFSFPNWLRYSSLLVAFGLSSFGLAQNNSELKYTTSDIEKLIKQDTVITLKLQIVDGFNGSPISGAKVYLNKKKRKISTITDENGYFELQVPTKDLKNFLIIENKYLKKEFPIRSIINHETIGIIPEIIIGKIEFQKSKSMAFLNSISKFFI